MSEPIFNLSKNEQIVYDLIRNCDRRITQLQIARAAPQLGSHEKHEGYMSMDSTLRKIRQIVRDLVMKHGLHILSDGKGYWIKQSQEEAEKYMKIFERQAKASAKSYMQRYHVMSKVFGIRSDYFDQQGKLFD
jgi:hypothetical protein